jgi:hypothetical protein
VRSKGQLLRPRTRTGTSDRVRRDTVLRCQGPLRARLALTHPYPVVWLLRRRERPMQSVILRRRHRRPRGTGASRRGAAGVLGDRAPCGGCAPPHPLGTPGTGRSARPRAGGHSAGRRAAPCARPPRPGAAACELQRSQRENVWMQYGCQVPRCWPIALAISRCPFLTKRAIGIPRIW